MIIIWTRHAEDRQKQWTKKLGITRRNIEEVLINPEQIVKGDQDILIAQSRWRKGLLRVPFKETEEGRKVITVYWTSRMVKYWREKTNEN
jgi:hypothetical protein